MPSKPGILVLCTGNSCRSQMAEGFLRHHAGDRFDVSSAGTEPAERVHPLSVTVMEERGIDLSSHRPRSIDEFLGVVPVHTAIIVCGGADRSCPAVWPGIQERLFWPFDDPASFEGSDEARLARFREIRDQIEARVVEWLETDAPSA